MWGPAVTMPCPWRGEKQESIWDWGEDVWDDHWPRGKGSQPPLTGISEAERCWGFGLSQAGQETPGPLPQLQPAGEA